MESEQDVVVIPKDLLDQISEISQTYSKLVQDLDDKENKNVTSHDLDLAAFDRLCELCIDGPNGTEALEHLNKFAIVSGLLSEED